MYFYDNLAKFRYEIKEVARYQYDAFGKCTVLNPDGTENAEADFIGNINPIRWKSMYCDVETGFYYIEGRYYSPEIRRYLSASSPKTMLDRATAVFGLNAYLITLDNCVIHGKTIMRRGEKKIKIM